MLKNSDKRNYLWEMEMGWQGIEKKDLFHTLCTGNVFTRSMYYYFNNNNNTIDNTFEDYF